MHKPIVKLAFMSLAVFIHASSQAAPEIDFSKMEGSVRKIEADLSKLDKAFYDPTPGKRDDGLAVGKYPDKANIIALAKEIADGEHAAYDSVLIAHKDKLVFESYYAYGRVNLPHYQASATKGYASFAVGRAIQMGYLSMQDLHKPVLAFLKDVDQDNLAEGVRKITLHHTLSMRSGLRISWEKQQALLKNPELVKGQKLAHTYLTHSSAVTDDSQVYKYQSIDPQITMLVLDAVVPGTAMEFIKAQLLDKLGINQYFWGDNVSGVPESAHSTSMNSRDMIKWATLLKDNGKWRGQQLISKAYLTQAAGSIAQPHSETFDFSNFRYGYYFWGTKLKVGDKLYNTKLAWGGGGQYAMALDELDLVIAVTARGRGVEDNTLGLVEERILPVFVSME